MSPSSRFLVVLVFLGVFVFPGTVRAQETQTGSELTDTGALLEIQRLENEKWQARRERTAGFWAAMMNSRKAAAAFREQQAIREEKLLEKRIQCREDIRRANRDTVEQVTVGCFRATLTLDLEMLRKEKQSVETVAGPTEYFRKSALFHIGNLMDALSTVIQAIDAGVYEGKEDLREAKQNLDKTYRENRRLAVTRLRIDRAITWLQLLMIRLENVRKTQPTEEVTARLTDAIRCLERKEEMLNALLPLENNQILIEGFRQVQSEVKICRPAS